MDFWKHTPMKVIDFGLSDFDWFYIPCNLGNVRTCWIMICWHDYEHLIDLLLNIKISCFFF